jgi:hypothetical protein
VDEHGKEKERNPQQEIRWGGGEKGGEETTARFKKIAWIFVIVEKANRRLRALFLLLNEVVKESRV